MEYINKQMSPTKTNGWTRLSFLIEIDLMYSYEAGTKPEHFLLILMNNISRHLHYNCSSKRGPVDMVEVNYLHQLQVVFASL